MDGQHENSLHPYTNHKLSLQGSGRGGGGGVGIKT